MGFKGVEDLHDRVTMIQETLLSQRHIHLRFVFLQAEIRVLFKPPRRYLALAYTTQDR